MVQSQFCSSLHSTVASPMRKSQLLFFFLFLFLFYGEHAERPRPLTVRDALLAHPWQLALFASLRADQKVRQRSFFKTGVSPPWGDCPSLLDSEMASLFFASSEFIIIVHSRFCTSLSAFSFSKEEAEFPFLGT